MTFRRLPSLAVALALPLASVAQDKGPSADDIQALQKKFQEERAAALEKKFPASSLERADEQAKRADEALKNGEAAAAAKFIHEARWLVPYVPPRLPADVERVLGVARLKHGDVVTAIAFSPDGRRLATASGLLDPRIPPRYTT